MKKIKFKLLKKIALLIAPFVGFGCYPSYAANPSISQNQKATQDTITTLQKLSQYEIDEYSLLEQSIENINNPEIKAKLLTFRNICESDTRQLSDLVQKYGGQVLTYSKDFKGYFMNGYAAMRGAFTDKGALNALDTNLKLILKAFESALALPLPKEAQDVVKKICENKKEILDYLKREIKK